MLPRWHIFLGALFALLLWFAADIHWFYALLVFASSVLIDFDHYLNVVIKKKKLSLFHAFDYHKKLHKQELEEKHRGIFRKGDFHLFHTIEFQVLVGLLGLVWAGFFYIFIGMVFHSILDIAYSLHEERLYRQEFLLFNWLRS